MRPLTSELLSKGEEEISTLPGAECSTLLESFANNFQVKEDAVGIALGGGDKKNPPSFLDDMHQEITYLHI